ncbi:class I SAM-dependent methyltransferase [Halocola ammonii]
MNKQQLTDAFGWDVKNWSRTIPFWEKHLNFSKLQNSRSLEIGCRFGGLSLFLALEGSQVLCTDLIDPDEKTRQIHYKHGVSDKVSYQSMDVLDIPFENEFDIICFKSVLGGVGRQGRSDLQQKAIEQIHQALKPGGVLLFAENLKASTFHQAMRKKFVQWGDEWNYPTLSEIKSLCSEFDETQLSTGGFLGAFGRSNKQRNALATLDRALDKLTSPSQRYVCFGFAKKQK